MVLYIISKFLKVPKDEKFMIFRYLLRYPGKVIMVLWGQYLCVNLKSQNICLTFLFLLWYILIEHTDLKYITQWIFTFVPLMSAHKLFLESWKAPSSPVSVVPRPPKVTSLWLPSDSITCSWTSYKWYLTVYTFCAWAFLTYP